MDYAIATAVVKFRLDVNFGDPVTPAPRHLSLPSLRPGMPPVRVLGYPIETVLAEKITTAIGLGPANTRVRDYADIYTLTGIHAINHRTARQALLATAAHRAIAVHRYPPPSAASQDSGARPTTPTALGSAVPACSFPPTLSHW